MKRNHTPHITSQFYVANQLATPLLASLTWISIWPLNLFFLNVEYLLKKLKISLLLVWGLGCQHKVIHFTSWNSLWASMYLTSIFILSTNFTPGLFYNVTLTLYKPITVCWSSTDIIIISLNVTLSCHDIVTVEYILSQKNAMSLMGFDPRTSHIVSHLSTNWAKGDLH